MVSDNRRSVKLVIPAIKDAQNQRELAEMLADSGWPVIPWIKTRTKIAARKGFSFNDSDIAEDHDRIELWPRKWQAGLACSWRTGLIVFDIDFPEEFQKWDVSRDIPDSVRVGTGRTGGYHIYLDCRHLRVPVGLDNWPTQGDIPGGQLKTNGFVAAPGSYHPNGKRYEALDARTAVARGSLELVRALASYRGTERARARQAGSAGSVEYLAELYREAINAPQNQQHTAIRNLINEWQRNGSDELIIAGLFPLLIENLRSYERTDPYDTKGLMEYLKHRPNRPRPVYVTAEEQADLSGIEPRLSAPPEELEFWQSRDDLSRIQEWAHAQMVSPWALLGEVIAEVLARVPPTFVLPRIVGSYGSLNMLLAIVGPPSAGKSAASAVVDDALDIDEPDIDLMRPDRIPLGSGEGLVKNYVHNSAGQTEQHAHTSIATCYEIDTFTALVERGGATLTAELRKMYSGEDLGFGYGNAHNRLVVRKFAYRGILVAGVQPERSGVILSNTGSGFAQRWMLLDATNPYAPDAEPERPEPLKWALPRSLYEMDHDAGKPLEIMGICESAVEEIRAARRIDNRGHGDNLRAHFLFTQEKFAAGLAILGMRTEITEDDWKLAAYAMLRSEELRLRCESALRKAEHATARKAGWRRGIEEVAAEETKTHVSNRRLWKLVLKHIPAKGRISRGALGKKMPQHRGEPLNTALSELITAGRITKETEPYNGRDVDYYSRVKNIG